ncbi:MAG: ABC transporter ATP-binding protein [Planctomycetota bacterium]|jgi:ABC-2 type transport system ATP-binding protein
MSAAPPHRPSETAVRVRGLRQSYRSGFLLRPKEALCGVDLEWSPGRVSGLLGPNGSGKSTLLRAVAGLERPRAGTIEVFGCEPTDRAVRGRVGFLPEGFPYPQELRGAEALTLLGKARGVERSRAKGVAQSWLERVGLAEAAKRPLWTYSTGMRRRFGLAQALVHEPDLVLLDEPSAGLDVAGFELLDELLAELEGRGATVLVCSHHGADLFASGRELTVLIDGRVALSAPFEELAARAPGFELELGRGAERAPIDWSRVRAPLEALGLTWIGARPSARATHALFSELAEESAEER